MGYCIKPAMKQKIIILGAGIAGLSAAIALKKAGHEFVIFESAPELQPVGAGLALAANAIRSFHQLHVAEDVIQAGRKLSGMDILDEKGKIITTTNTQRLAEKYGLGNYAIHRAALQEILLRHTGPEHVILNKKATHVEQQGDKVQVYFSDKTVEEGDFLIAAEGIHSPVRQQLAPRSQPRYAGYTCWRAVTSYPADPGMQASETWGTKGRFGIVPLVDDKVYWFACVSAKPNDPVLRAWNVKDLAENFKAYHAPIEPILNHTSDEQLLHNDICDIKPIRRYAYEKILLVGDAAHATTPNMGQGACQAIEDAACLAHLLAAGHDLAYAFVTLEKLRMKRTHWIINRSRSAGKLAQMTNPLVSRIRNQLLRTIPDRVNEQQLAFLYQAEW